ncbi:M20 family metallopeptidase [Candidatus Woesearchaeota archaeon]|nr:M20 family metallopeptidase [Candidatus Woesearchaeota archaeon]
MDKEVKENEQQCKALLKSIISKQTVNPPGNEYLAASVIKTFLKNHKIPFKVYAKDKKRPNMIVEIGKGRSTLIACHLDVVPAGEGWKSDPFRPIEKKGKIFGRGSSDNKGALASALIAASILKSYEHRLKKKFIFAFVSDEERGNAYGMDFLLKKNLVRADFAIIPDMDGHLDMIAIGEKGYLDIKITSIGRQAHSSDPGSGINALQNLADFVSLLNKHRMKFRKDKLFTPPTLVPAMMSAGSAPNIVPGKAELILNIRYLPSQDPKRILSDLKVLSKRVRGSRFRFEIGQHLPPHKLRISGPITDLQKTMKRITGRKPKLKGLSGATFAKPLNIRGIKAVAIGCSPKHVAHMADEYIEVSQLADMTRLVCYYAFG